jgi:acyl-CoA dehydrogenase
MYQAPVREISFTLKHVAGLKEAIDSGRLDGLSEDVVDAVLEEAGRFASTAVAPLNLPGDLEGARWEDGRVLMPTGWAALYRQWREAGWNGLSAPEKFGGQGLPMLMSVAALEMWNAASMAFGLGPTLTMGAIEALVAHATPELQGRYLPKLVSGEWMGTMNLTEPQAGSDLSALTTRAEPQDDGTFRLFGQKIFITYGEHDMAENIVHLVLARP